VEQQNIDAELEYEIEQAKANHDQQQNNQGEKSGGK
jgi:hypothetical protein